MFSSCPKNASRVQQQFFKGGKRGRSHNCHEEVRNFEKYQVSVEEAKGDEGGGLLTDGRYRQLFDARCPSMNTPDVGFSQDKKI